MKKRVIAVITFLPLISFLCLALNVNDYHLKSNKSDDTIAHAHLGELSTDTLFDDLLNIEASATYIDDTYASLYFNNLRTNFSNNAYGTCAYVFIGMLLSFYDTYWDDSFVSETYDVTSSFESDRQMFADFDLVPLNADSPGIAFEPSTLVDNLTSSEYLSLINTLSDDYFQFYLISLQRQYISPLTYDDEDILGLTNAKIVQLLNLYLHSVLGFSFTDVTVNQTLGSSSSNIEGDVIDNIIDGIPSILVVENPTTNEAHSVIAYDYDSTTNDIYVHPGWRNDTTNSVVTHCSLDDLGYTQIISATNLLINTTPSLGFSYISSSGSSYCSSHFAFPRDIRLVSGNYADTRPTFTWKSLYKEKWFESYDPYFTFSILNLNRARIFQVSCVNNVRYTLTTSEWEQTRFDVSGESYYAFITLNSSQSQYWDEIWCRELFKKPSDYLDKPYIAPDEYDFADSYPTDQETRNTFEEHTVRGFTFETRRYRTGYIHNEYITMSPIRSGISEAFIEYRFDTALTRIDVELSHWREESSEILNANNGMAAVQQFIDNSWVTVLDLLSEETALTRNRLSPNTYKIEFLQPTYRIRFFSNYDLVTTNENNRGRICIGNMAFYESEYSLPLSGYELDYNYANWTSPEYNCYAYALNTKNHGFMQPGQSEGHNYRNTINYFTKTVLENMVGLDAYHCSFTFEPINKNDKCEEDCYKVALVIAPNRDYHWYRQNSDGTWSHKCGYDVVRNTDFSGNLIFDPEFCNREYDANLNYTQFVGFYEINVTAMI